MIIRQTDKQEQATPSRRRQGFTLVEVIMAFVVTGIAMSASVSLWSTAMVGTNFVSHRMDAAAIAKSRIEHLRSLPFDSLDAMTEDLVQVNEHGVADAEGAYFRSTNIGDDVFASRIVRVIVNSQWKHDAPVLEVEMATILLDQDVVK